MHPDIANGSATVETFLASLLADQLTLPQAVRRVAAAGLGEFTYLDGDPPVALSTAHWLSLSERIHGGLRAAGLPAGTAVILQLEHGAHFVIAFWGVLLGGYVPVPLAVPESLHPGSAGLRKLLAVADVLPKSSVLTDSADGAALKQLHDRGQLTAPVLRYEALLEAAAVPDHNGRCDDLALLMFSSGSTGFPKAVQLTHGNLLHNVWQIAVRTGLQAGERSLTWLPYNHDMGLILFHLTHALCGLAQFKLDSLSFMKDPLRFLQLLQRHEISITGYPNFAFDHLLRRVTAAELAALDLSRLRVICNGAEPISPALCREFIAAMAPARLRRDAILAGFGIAEACVCASSIAFEPNGRAAICPSLIVNRRMLADGHVQQVAATHPDALELADLGAAMDGMQIRAVDDTGRQLPESHVGNLQIKGPNVTRGYHRPGSPVRPAEDWIDSGDLGFLYNSHVVICGRAKDIIFVNGRNFYAHDLEESVQARAGLPAGDVAVCATRSSDQRCEQIALFVRASHVDDGLLRKLAQARASLAYELKYRIHAVVALSTLPRTSSGKIQRFALAQRLANGEFEKEIGVLQARLAALRIAIAAETALESALLELTSTLAESSGEGLSVEAGLIELLGDSLRVAQYLALLQRRLPHPACSQLTLAHLYEHSTVRALADFLEADGAEERPALLPRTLHEGPLSRGQQDLWFWQRFDNSSARYHEAYACTLTGGIKIDRLRQALGAAVNQYAALRTVFDDSAATIRQRVLPQVALNFEQLDSQLAEADVAERFQALAAQPFDMAVAPLHRFAAQVRADGSVRLLLVFPHLIMDGWSWRSFFTALRDCHDTADASRTEPLNALDYYAWVEQRRAGAEYQALRRYWTGLFSNPPPAYRLGLDAEAAGATAVHEQLVSNDTVVQWQAIARNFGLTPYQLALAAYLLLVAQRSGQPDISVGVTSPGRSDKAALDLVGYLSNTLALRLDLRSCRTLWDVAAKVREQASALLLRQDFPLSEFVSAAAGSGAPRPPFACALSFLPAPEALLPQHWGCRDLTRFRGPAKLDLLLNIETTPQGWRVLWEYDTARFDAAALDAWHVEWRALLEVFARGPVFPLIALRMSAAAADLPAAAHAARTSPRFARVSDYFDAAAAAHPQRMALADDAQQLSYRELQIRVDRLASWLRQRGALPGTRVAVLLPKGVNLGLVTLAIVKAGAAYLPCDPEFPDARLEQILARTSPLAVLASPELAARIATRIPQGTQVFHVEELLAIAQDEARPAEVGAITRPEDPIYLHFTSGSTGEPKGILNTHASVCHLIDWFVRSAVYRDGDAVPQLVSYAFEAFVAELFPTLALGGCLHSFPPLRELSPQAAAERFIRCGIRVATVSPSYALQLSQGMAEHKVRPPLRALLFGGEALLPSHVQQIRKVFGPDLLLFNLYGPTEATVHATFWPVPHGSHEIRIGRPLDGKKIVLLDECGWLCPPGEAGEICIGGAGLALGYWQDPKRTAQAFVELHLQAGKPERFYRSGDLGVFDGDGTLRFLGRRDHQVKVNGQRVEVEEVEQALAALPGITETAVIAEELQHGRHRLLAYCSGPAAADSEALRAKLAQRLPPYMIPAHFLALQELPKSANAKIDRQALLALRNATGSSEVSGAEAAEVATDCIEQTVMAAWKKVLRNTAVENNANFFTVGGDSILALELSSALTQLSCPLSPKEIYEWPTIRAQVSLLAERRNSAGTQDDEPAVTGSVALTPIQHWFCELPLGKPSHWLQSIAISVREPLDAAALRKALLSLVNHHDQLRAVLRLSRRNIQQRVREPATSLELQTIDLSDAAEEQCKTRRAALAASLAERIELSQQLFAAALVCHAGSCEIWLAAHHLVVDTVSWRILLADLKSAYEQCIAGRAAVLPRKSTSYQRFADALEARAADLHWQASTLRTWQSWLGARAPRFAAAECPAVPLRDYTSMELRFGGEISAILRGHDGLLGQTKPQDAWLTVLCRALSTASGSPDVVLDLESHGRTDPGTNIDLTRTVGWCTALYPFHAWIATAEAPADTLARLANAHSRIVLRAADFGVLRYLSQLPEFDSYVPPAVNFNYLGQLAGTTQDNWAVGNSPVPLFVPEDPPPYSVIAQVWQSGEDTVLQLALHPELAQRWPDFGATLQAEAAALAEDCSRLAAKVSPLRFDQVTLSSVEAGELPANTIDAYPMTPMQEAMYFHTRDNPASALYHEQTVYRCDDVLDPARLEAALVVAVKRHDMLRTIFRVVGLRLPLQLVLATDRVEIEVQPLAGPSKEGTPAAIQQYLADERANRRFNPEHWPLWRLALFQASDHSYLVFSFHHILLDGWSQALLIAELLKNYRELAAGTEPDTLPLAGRMRDHVARVTQVIADPAARAFWDERLAFPPSNNLPFDLPRPAEREVVGATVTTLLAEPTVVQLEQVAAALGVTVNALCLGGWVYFLHTLSGDEDIVTGMVTAGRYADLPNAMQLLGCFLNTLPVRLVVEEATASLAELARSAQAFLNDSRPHDTFPLKEIVTLVQQRQPDRHNRELFQHLYAFENYPTNAADEQGLELIDGYDMTHYDLTAVLVKRGRSLRVMFEYAPDVLQAVTAQRWLHQFAHILSVLAEQPQAPASSLDLRPPSQRALLKQYNATARSYDLSATLHDLFSEQAGKTPNRIAVQDRLGTLSYGQLDRQSNQLAHTLQALGMTAEVLGAVLMPRRCDALVAFYAVLKAGGAYVPIDPAYPLERIAGIIEDAGIEIVVTCSTVLEMQPGLLARLPAVCRLVFVDAAPPENPAIDKARWSLQPQTPPACPAHAQHLGYIIFTSGSTGKPKGVMIRHRSAVNTLYAINELYEISAADCILGFSSFCFDLSVYDIFGTLAVGARLVIATEEDTRDADRLFDLVCSTGVTVWNSVPTGLSQLVRSLLLREAVPRYGQLRRIMLSGEFIPLTLPQDARRIFPDARIDSLGGATEGSIWSIRYPIETVDPAWRSIPYGRPLPNQGYYVLTEGMQPCLIDQVGMLYITGDGVAAGYFRDEEKTARAFIADPLLPPSAPPIYRTGDIGRLRADGNIEILGRKDMQVKIRGYRIELGEIENQLGQLPGIGDVAVIVLRDGEHNRLAAFYTADQDDLESEQLAHFLESRLPQYMVPGRLQRLAAMPLNSSGKIDRRQLPALLESITSESAKVTELAGELEQAIAAAWSRVLRVAGIGPDHNFFILGGDSIMSLQVAAALAESGIRIRPADLVRHPTVRGLATVVANRQSESAAVNDTTAAPVLAPAQRWFFEELRLERPDHWHLSMELETEETLDAARLAQALTVLINRHPVLRWQRDADKKAFIQAGTVIGVRLHEMTLADSAQGELADFGSKLREGIRLAADQPLYAAGLVHRPGGRSRFIWVVHHLLVDGVSWRILLDELKRLYRDPNAVLPPTGASFAAWAQRVAALAPRLDPAADSRSWQQYFSRDWPELFSGTERSEGDAVRAGGTLPAELTGQLLGAANTSLNTRPQDLLLSALVLALHEQTGERALCIALEHHGRNLADDELDLSRTVGWFTAFYPLAVELEPNPTPLAVVAAVKDAQRAIGERAALYMAWAYGGEARPAALKTRRPPQVLFNYLGNLDGVQLAEGWHMAAPSSPERAAACRRSHAIDMSVHVAGERLHWDVSTSIGDAGLAGRLSAGLARWLSVIATQCLAASPTKTPSDFPLLWPTQRQLARLQDNIDDAYPLTAMQAGMYYAAKAYPDTPMYHVNAYATLRMPLDVAALEEALNRLAARHEILRTVVLAEGFDPPVQAVLSQVRYRVELLENVAPEEFFTGLPAALHDIGQWPNIAVAVSRIAPDTYHFLQFFKHLLLDGWSNALFFSRLLQEYRILVDARSTGSAVAMHEAPAPLYRDFIAHQIAAGRNQQALAFWRDELAGAAAAALPVDRLPRTPRTFRTVIVERVLDRAEANALREHAKRLGCTVSDLLLGGYALLCYRLTGQQDAVFGYCASIRPAELPGIQHAIGMFLNTIPLRLRWLAGLSASEQFAAWRTTLSRCRAYEDVPLTSIAAAVKNHSELFRHGGLRLLYTSETYPGASLPDGVVGVGSHNWHMTEFDFALVYSGEGAQGILLKLAWADDLFAAETIDRWFDLYRDCLAELTGRTTEHRTVVEEGLAGTRDFAARWRERVALSSGQTAIETASVLNYAGLDQAAAAVANTVFAMDPECTAVLLDCENGLWYGVGLIAMLVAGRPFLPVAPTDPLRERLMLVERLGVRRPLILTDRAEQWLELVGDQCAVIDLPAAARSTAKGWPDVAQGDIAYCVATSGSTGEPKLVQIGRDALAHFLDWYGKAIGLQAGDRVSHYLGRGFDAALSEWLPALFGGATVVVGSSLTALSHAAFQDELLKHRVSLLTLPSAYLDAWIMRNVSVALPPELRRVVVGGAPLKTRTVREWQAHTHGRIPILNAYGPAEATIAVSVCEVDRPVDELFGTAGVAVDSDYLPIGRASNTLAVVDSLGRICPPGVQGELMLSGRQLMRGYVGAQPLSAHPTWRTGDAATVSVNGAVTVLGRIGEWIKISGRRVHPGALEARLGSLPGIAELVVRVAADSPEARLSIYYVDTQGRTAATLRALFASHLPNGVMPRLHAVAHIPLTHNGKPDWAALEASVAAAGPAVPSDSPEAMSLWQFLQQVLQTPGVDPAAGWFANGGDSLRALTLQSELLNRFELNVPLETLLSAAALGDLLKDWAAELQRRQHH